MRGERGKVPGKSGPALPGGAEIRVPDQTIAVIPSFNPDENLAAVAKHLLEAGFGEVVIVDDGSREDTKPFFPEAGAGIVRLGHECNMGKGRALKTAFAFILEHRPACQTVVTVDGDGQHSARDSARVALHTLETGSAVLGARDFGLEHVPFRSRLGNVFTRGAFRLLFGLKLRDTQTGLRGFPAELLPLLTELPGERFEYESTMLLEFRKKRIPLREITIDTLYESGNKSSHYRTFADSALIFSAAAGFLKFSLSSLLAALLDNGLFYILVRILASFLGMHTLTVSFFTARALSSAFNFALNRKAVFADTGDVKKSMLRYYALAIVQFIIGNAVLNWIVQPAGPVNAEAVFATAVKILIDTLLFLLGYQIQRKWVFRK